MSLSLTSSQVVCKSAGYAPIGVKAVADGVCALCGHEIKTGDLQVPLSLGSGFMDDLYMAGRGSSVVCGWCVPCMGKEGLMNTGYGAFSAATAPMPFRKWGDIAFVLLNPPPPPFVMLYATANNQHMAWRAVVNYSVDQFYVRVGLRDLKIRLGVLKQAVDDCKLLGEALVKKSGKKPAVEKKTVPHPFVNLSPDLKDVEHGMFHPNVYALVAESSLYAEAFLRLISITLGESWALRFVLGIYEGQGTTSP